MSNTTITITTEQFRRLLYAVGTANSLHQRLREDAEGTMHVSQYRQDVNEQTARIVYDELYKLQSEIYASL